MRAETDLRSNKSLNLFYLVIFVSMVMLSGTLLYVINDNSSKLYTSIDESRIDQQEKISIMFKIMSVLRERTDRLMQMNKVDDAFELYALDVQLTEDAAEFVRIKDQLAMTELTPAEQTALDNVLNVITQYIPQEREVINLLMQDDSESIQTKLLDEIMPLQGTIYVGGMKLFEEITGSGKFQEKQFQEQRESIHMQIYMLSLCIAIAAIVYLAIVFLRMRLEDVVEERTSELTKTLSRLKVLEGLISICVYCKSIRTPEGVWSMLEEYIQKHSNARFSHGVCPECAIKERDKIRSARNS